MKTWQRSILALFALLAVFGGVAYALVGHLIGGEFETRHLRIEDLLRREPVQLDLPDDADLTLLDVLREFLGITSPKNGCQPIT